MRYDEDEWKRETVANFSREFERESKNHTVEWCRGESNPFHSYNTLFFLSLVLSLV